LEGELIVYQNCMQNKIKKNLFYIGVIIFSLTLFVEHLFLGQTNLTCFFKGFASAIQLVGVIILIRNKNK